MKLFKLTNLKPKIMVFQGSTRHKDSCPEMMSKSHYMVDYIKRTFSDKAQLDICDLSIQRDKPNIQPCKGCISSAGGFHCHWYCSCYSKDSKVPDLIYEEDIYKRLEECDAFIVVTPIHWYAPSSTVKLLFDRLVCANLTLTQEQAKEINMLDEKGWKQLDNYTNITEKKKVEYKLKMKNHLANKFAGFLIHGDDGADDYALKNLPPSYVKEDKVNDPKQAIMPIVAQCRYSGIFVPDECIKGIHINKNKSYFEANKTKVDTKIKNEIDSLVENLLFNIQQYNMV